MGYKASDFLTSNAYIKKEDVRQAPMKAVIASVEVAKLPDGKETLQLVLQGGKKLTLNKTNTRRLQGAFGDEVDTWVDKKVAISFDPNVMYGSSMVGGLRVTAITPKPAVVADDPELADIPF